jgi:SAM-dependent methyltransferase
MKSITNALTSEINRMLRAKYGETRSPEELVVHYNLERKLSDRLRSAPEIERRRLYSQVYNEIFNMPDHPMLNRKNQSNLTDSQFLILEPYLNGDSIFLEIGPGDCSLSLKIAQHVNRVYAVDVSHEIAASSQRLPNNFELVITDGINIPIKESSVDVAYCSSLIEHLHPDDVAAHLDQIHTILKPGGVFICSTCNRLDGPHDVSRWFDDVPMGFHLREYTHSELGLLFRNAGFSWTKKHFRFASRSFSVPLSAVTPIEKIVDVIPRSPRLLMVLHFPLLHKLLYIRIVAGKT